MPWSPRTIPWFWAVDRLNEIGVPCFGPKQNAAILEGSKGLCQDLMKKYHIPTARYETFSDLQAALDYVQAQPLPLVVKADGLALGKGVLICQTREGGHRCSHRYDGKRQIRHLCWPLRMAKP